jgi:BON domain
MRRLKRYSLTIVVIITTFVLLMLISPLGPSRKVAASATPVPLPATDFTVLATGLNNPRGLKFGPDGNLYVAEGGTGGTNSTVGTCEQVVAPVGPYLGSNTGGRISKIDQNGIRTTVIDTLPSSQTSAALGSLISGVADVAFVGDTLYALLAGAGCSHGVTSLPNGIVRINPNGTATLIANLSAFQQANPVENPEPGDFEPDGTWYSMVEVRGDLYAVEPNHGEVDKISTDGQITRVVDVSATVGHIVPTAITYKGNFFFGNLGTFPVVPGTEEIRKLTPSGQHKTWAANVTTVLGLAFDGRDRLYVLESLTNPGFPGPGQLGSGRVVRINPNGSQTVIATGLSFPGGMTLGPDGALYVSNFSFGVPPGLGQIVRIDVPTTTSKNLVHVDTALPAQLEDVSRVPAQTVQTNIGPETVPQQSVKSNIAPATAPRQSVLILGQPAQLRGEEATTDSDVSLQQVASNKLSEDSKLSSVSVIINEARAVLTGTVGSSAAKARAEKLIGTVRGLKSIDNKINVTGP